MLNVKTDLHEPAIKTLRSKFMGFFDFLKQPNINDGVSRFKAESKGVLLDVRTKEDIAKGIYQTV